MFLRRAIGGFGCVVGKGLLAGLAGTVVLTMLQAAEKDTEGGAPGTLPAQAVEKVFGIKAVDEEHEAWFSRMIHWVYGTAWGLFRSFLGLLGMRGFHASLIHWATISGMATIMLPRLGVTPPARQWPLQMHVSEGVQHFVYALVVGMVYDQVE